VTLTRILWEHSPIFTTFDEFAKRLEGWTIDPLYGPRGLEAIFVVKGPAFHFAKIDPEARATKAVLERYPGQLIEKYGYATTSTPKTDTRVLRFNRAIGFVVTGEDELDVHQRIERLRFMNTKDTPCRFQ
jgi:hypothetical protein